MKKEIDVNRLWINEEITQKSGAKYVKQLCEFINEGKPIIIYLNSVGGDVDEGLAIVDLIEHAKSRRCWPGMGSIFPRPRGRIS